MHSSITKTITDTIGIINRAVGVLQIEPFAVISIKPALKFIEEAITMLITDL